MLAKCSKCGYENQLNSIFCRGCGEKLNPEEISPEALAEEAKKRKKANRKINWRPIVGLILLAAAVTYGFLLFTAPEGTPVYKLDKGITYKAELKKIERGSSAEVTPEQLTAYFNESLIDKSAAKEGGNYAIKSVIFTGKGNLLTITIHTTVLTLDTVLTVTGKLKKGPDSAPINFEITGFRFGKAPLPFLRDHLLKNFDPVFYAESLQTIFRNAEDVTFNDGKLNIVKKLITTKKPITWK